MRLRYTYALIISSIEEMDLLNLSAFTIALFFAEKTGEDISSVVEAGDFTFIDSE